MKRINKGIKLTALLLAGSLLTGCVGSNFVTAKVMEFNVKVVDNRYARGGVNFLLAPVYGFTILADSFVVNSIEFWTGSNPFSGSPHIFDSKVDTMIDVNDQLDPSLQDAPIDPLTFQREVEKGSIKAIDENTVQMDISYTDGEKATIIGNKEGDVIRYYIDGELVSKTTIQDLESAFKPDPIS